eukprot:g13289.t1
MLYLTLIHKRTFTDHKRCGEAFLKLPEPDGIAKTLSLSLDHKMRFAGNLKVRLTYAAFLWTKLNMKPAQLETQRAIQEALLQEGGDLQAQAAMMNQFEQMKSSRSPSSSSPNSNNRSPASPGSVYSRGSGLGTTAAPPPKSYNSQHSTTHSNYSSPPPQRAQPRTGMMGSGGASGPAAGATTSSTSRGAKGSSSSSAANNNKPSASSSSGTSSSTGAGGANATSSSKADGKAARQDESVNGKKDPPNHRSQSSKKRSAASATTSKSKAQAAPPLDPEEAKRQKELAEKREEIKKKARESQLAKIKALSDTSAPPSPAPKSASSASPTPTRRVVVERVRSPDNAASGGPKAGAVGSVAEENKTTEENSASAAPRCLRSDCKREERRGNFVSNGKQSDGAVCCLRGCQQGKRENGKTSRDVRTPGGREKQSSPGTKTGIGNEGSFSVAARALTAAV